MIRRIAIVIAVVFAATLTKAQIAKVAYIDLEFVYGKIPEYGQARTQIDSLAAGWQRKVEAGAEELEKMESDYRNEQILLTEDLKKIREKKIKAKRAEIEWYTNSKFGKNGELEQLKMKLLDPINQRILAACSNVAKKNRLDFIFAKSDEITLLYTGSKYDWSEEVLEEMGILKITNRKHKVKKDEDEE